MINIDDLLKPVAEDKPCGEDFSYHPSLQNLEAISRGKPEVEMGEFKKPAEEPDWKEVRDAAIEVLGQSKHLSAAVILTTALVRIGGLEGLRDGLAVVRGLTEKFWNNLYPKLDPEDQNDPTERLNILGNLAGQKFAADLKQVVLCQSPGMGRITVLQYLAAKDVSSKTDAAGGTGSKVTPDMSQINAAFQQAGPDAARATLSLLNEAIAHASGLAAFLDAQLGAGRGVNFEVLNKLLGETKQMVERYSASDAPAEAGLGEGVPSESGGQVAPRGRGLSGNIQTRDDVVKAIGLIREYYRDNEPSSPVPLILQRAERLVNKDFMTIMTDLTPDALKQLRVITGTKEEE